MKPGKNREIAQGCIEIRKLGANLFLTIIYLQISRIFRTCWVTHLKFIE